MLLHKNIVSSYGISLIYSECGTMVGAAYCSHKVSIISTYNVLSGIHLYSHQSGGIVGRRFWTHGKCIRYATFASRSVIIWEFGFASRREPTQVVSLSTPDTFHSSTPLIHPTLSRLAFIRQKAVLIWDGRESRFLLDAKDVENPVGISFSLDGCLFACGTTGMEIYLWKESPIGYVLHRKFTSRYECSKNRISPDGGSIVEWGGLGVRLWRTAGPTTPLPNSSTQTPLHTGICMVVFSPGEVFAAIARLRDNLVTILDLKSGDPWLVIDTGMEVYGLGVGRTAIVVVGEGNIVTWDLSAGSCALKTRAHICDSVRTITFAQPPILDRFPHNPPLSICPDLHRMAFMGGFKGGPSGLIEHSLYLYNVSTGQCLASASMERWGMARFALGGHEVWCWIGDDKAEGWSIVEDSEVVVTRLERIGVTADPPGGFPWVSSRGYEVTDDGWVLGPSAKRLLWLPPYLRLDRTYRVWSGRFLAFLDPELSEPVLLELPAE